MSAPRDVLIAIDIEPNGRGQLGAEDWQATNLAFDQLSLWRQHLESATGAPVHFNWFLRCDPQIAKFWGSATFFETACPTLLRFLQTSEDLCGIHTHFWRWDANHHRWFSDFTDPAWIDHCLSSNIAAFETLFGYRPVASRGGDRFISTALTNQLLSLGIRYDLTVEPGVPDQPAVADYLQPEPTPAADALWEIPVTATTPPRWVPIRRFPYLIQASRPVNLVLCPRTLWNFLEHELHHSSAAPLQFVMRTGDFGHSHYLKNFQYLTEHISKHPAIHQLRFSRLDHAIQRFASTS